MTRSGLTEKILDIKRETGWSWQYICSEIGGISDGLIISALLGQMRLARPLAQRAAELFSLTRAEEAMLNEAPMRGTTMPPTDPLLYRFFEMVMVNGPAWKAMIEEEFGDGVMSTIDFDFELTRMPHENGDRVKLTLSGRFLPYRYYDAHLAVPEFDDEEE